MQKVRTDRTTALLSGCHRGHRGAAGGPHSHPAPVEALPGTGSQDPHLRNPGCCGPQPRGPPTLPRLCLLPELPVAVLQAPQQPPGWGPPRLREGRGSPCCPPARAGPSLPARPSTACLSWILPDPPAPLVPTPLSLEWSLMSLTPSESTAHCKMVACAWHEGGRAGDQVAEVEGGGAVSVGSCGAHAPGQDFGFYSG